MPALDITPITRWGTGTPPRIAARLCNFPTGHADPLVSHKNWLDHNVKPIIESVPFPWIDVIGYASHLGFEHHPGGLSDSQLNQRLSYRRCERGQENNRRL